jgi:hypothetical protein
MAIFLPLVPGAPMTSGPTMPTRLKPIPATPETFEPVTPATLKADANTAAPVPAPHAQHGPPKVTLEKHGELVTHIRVECGCGQVTELKCEY